MAVLAWFCRAVKTRRQPVSEGKVICQSEGKSTEGEGVKALSDIQSFLFYFVFLLLGVTSLFLFLFFSSFCVFYFFCQQYTQHTPRRESAISMQRRQSSKFYLRVFFIYCFLTFRFLFRLFPTGYSKPILLPIRLLKKNYIPQHHQSRSKHLYISIIKLKLGGMLWILIIQQTAT
ncbi:hypothetical protein QBC42DRAFT_71273 [Cladorrhinum samala]|uniref:Uncharacterized protein n=1 Tax=Cladorrhinum samala TaxID=585594 RepID=A0AAV9HQS3_9PEZI|nr:hypothetical protein QBC42DRAFT_71273 [Cladorrhinum samala]